MDQMEAQDDHKIAAVAGKGGAQLIYEEDKWAPEMIQPNLAQEAAAQIGADLAGSDNGSKGLGKKKSKKSKNCIII